MSGPTLAVRWEVYNRDGGCVPAKLGAPGVCRDQWQRSHGPDALEFMTLDHVQPGYGMMGKRPPHTPEYLVTTCWGHGVQSWELGHKPELRAYLSAWYPEVHGAHP